MKQRSYAFLEGKEEQEEKGAVLIKPDTAAWQSYFRQKAGTVVVPKEGEKESKEERERERENMARKTEKEDSPA